MLIAPLHHQRVVTGLTQSVLDDVFEVAHVYDVQLLTRHQRSGDSHHQHVVAYRRNATQNRPSYNQKVINSSDRHKLVILVKL